MPTGKAQPPTPLELAIAATIRDVIADRGLVAGQVAIDAGMSDSQLSRALSGKKPLKLGELIGLCRALSLSPSTVIAIAEAGVRQSG